MLIVFILKHLIFLQPDKSGEKAYFLLHDALVKSNKAGLGSFLPRNRENLCLIKPFNGILVLNKIRFSEEIRSLSEITVPKKSLNRKAH